MSSDQYGPGYGQGGQGYGQGGQGGQGYGGQGYGQGGPGYGQQPPGYGPPAGGQGSQGGQGGPGYGPPAGGPGGPGYGPGPGGPGGPGYGPGPSPYGGRPPQGAGYPVKVQFQYPEKLSRGLIFVKIFMLIPHFIVLYALGLCAGIASFIAWWAILFTGRYPRGLWNFVTGVLRWQTRVSSYMYLTHDAYPPFSLEDQ